MLTRRKAAVTGEEPVATVLKEHTRTKKVKLAPASPSSTVRTDLLLLGIVITN